MRQIKISAAFKKDKKRCQKRHDDFTKLQEVIFYYWLASLCRRAQDRTS